MRVLFIKLPLRKKPGNLSYVPRKSVATNISSPLKPFDCKQPLYLVLFVHIVFSRWTKYISAGSPLYFIFYSNVYCNTNTDLINFTFFSLPYNLCYNELFIFLSLLSSFLLKLISLYIYISLT